MARRMPICHASTTYLRRAIAFSAAASISASEVPARKIGALPASRAVFAMVNPPLCRIRGTAIAGFDLFAQVVPDRLAIIDEVLLVADLRDDARARQVDRVDRFHRRRAGSQHIDLVGKCDGFFEIVRHEHDGCLAFGPELQKLFMHNRAGLHVKRRERLVHQQDFRLVDEGLSQRNALAHAARELMRIVMQELGEPDAGEPVLGSLFRHGLRLAAEKRAGHDVFDNVLPREERVRLEHEADARVDAADRTAHQPDFAGAGLRKTGDEIERRRLAAACRSDNGDEFTALDGHVEIAKCRQRLAGRRYETAADIDKLYRRRAAFLRLHGADPDACLWACTQSPVNCRFRNPPEAAL
ncbi:hypothetical protein RHSP_79036 [Rhizobium freirei PRF 81]|uniref:Uncharacterized protein n=1 Tax=Rhizobium freirei PRF 81 TaxID=363754 RepID=N6U170_9HYPH|nr:hypothetical protein RHSP_79036 [Rhizobium freirei PRF 81]